MTGTATAPLSPGLRTARLPVPGTVAWTALIVAGYAANVVFRLVLAVGRVGPINFADEIGYLANARVLAGGVAGQLTEASFYRGGYSLLLVPAELLGDGPWSAYRYVLVTNALLSSLVFVLIYLLLRRTFAVAPWPALGAAVIAGFYPPLVLNSLIAWSEVALYVLVLFGALALHGLVSARSPRRAVGWGIAVGVVAAYLYATHGRTVPIVAVLLAALLVAGVLRRDLRLAALAGLLTAALGYLADGALSAYLLKRNWGFAGGVALDHTLGNLTNSAVLPNVGVLLLGQYWYLSVGTLGLFLLGVIGAAQYVGRRPFGRGLVAAESRGAALVAAYLLLSTLGLGILVGVFLFPVTRPDVVVYGRYIEIMLPALLALGLVRLWTLRSTLRIVVEMGISIVLIVVAALVAAGYQHHILLGQLSNSYTTLSIPALAGSILGIRPRRVTVLAVGGAILLVLLVRRARLVGAALVVAFFAYSAVYTRHTLMSATQLAVYGPGMVNRVSVPGLEHRQNIGYDVASYTIDSLWDYQWQLDDVHFVLFNSRLGELPPERYIIAAANWTGARTLGARIVWRTPLGSQVVWFVPSAPRAPVSRNATLPPWQ